eukprot:360854-Chlamydomonas_euryale.AAC.1
MGVRYTATIPPPPHFFPPVRPYAHLVDHGREVHRHDGGKEQRVGATVQRLALRQRSQLEQRVRCHHDGGGKANLAHRRACRGDFRACCKGYLEEAYCPGAQ